MSRLATPYVPRRPQETVLYGLVKEHWRDFVRHARRSKPWRVSQPSCLRPAIRCCASMGCSRRAIAGARVVPQPPSPAPRCKATAREHGEEGEKGARAEVRAPAPSAHAGDGRAIFRLQAGDAVVTSSLTTTGRAEEIAPNVLSIAHWERILEGELYAASARIDWRTLLKRTFDTELRVCARCGGRLVVRAVVTEPASVAKLLAALRRPRAPPAAA